MRTFPWSRSARSPRSGIALIIVLGFLALLTILVVAFAVMMRTERVAARSYQDVQRAKQLTYVGLSRVQVMLDDVLGGGAPKIYPNWQVTNSAGASLIDLNRTAALVSTSDSPRSLAADFIVGSSLTQALAASSRAGWTNIVIDNQNNQPTLVGRVAYVVVNDSGLLDANFAGGQPKKSGASPGELVVSNEVLTEFSSDTFAGVRSNTYKRFESIPDLTVCAQVGGCMPNGGRVSNLCVYSRAPRTVWDFAAGSLREPVYIGGDPATGARLVATQTDIEAGLQRAFTMAGEVLPSSLKVYQCLQDYTDADDRPQDVNSFCTEAVPFINEVVIQVTSKVAGAGYRYEFTPRVELFFPFVGVTNAKTYELRVGIVWDGAPSPAGYKPPNYGPPVVNIAPPPGNWTQGVYYVSLPSAFTPAVGADAALPPASWAGFKAKVICQLRESGVVVDQVGSAASQLLIDLSTLTTTIGDFREFGMAVNDPRFNYAVANPNQWKPVGASPGTTGAHTLSNENVRVVTYSTAATADGTNLVYVRNGSLSNSGELGMLPFDENKPWHTIRLVQSAAGLPHGVLDHFTVHSNLYTSGMVNPNSTNLDVILSALVGASANLSPAAFTTNVLSSVTTAEVLARQIRAQQPYTNRTALGRVVTGWPAGATDIYKEAVIRHTADLMNPRQNLFTVIVAAQAIRREPGKAYDAQVDEATEVVAEQRAVAVVWRDPFPVNGSYEQKVVFFKWLTE
jgi:hypothetical protein